MRGGPVLEKMLPNNGDLKMDAPASTGFERFATATLYRNYYLGHISGADLPFVGSSHLSNTDYVLSVGTPFAKFSASLSFLWGRTTISSVVGG